MNLDRFSFKAKHTSGYWIHGEFTKNGFGNFGFQWTRFNVPQGAFADIILETCCQCTGLKDSNGTPIFENDYVEILLNGSGEIWEEAALVEYSRLGFVYTCKDEEQPLHHLEFQMKEGLVKVYVVGNKWNK